MKQRTLINIYGTVLAVIFGLIALHAIIIVGFGTKVPDFSLVIKAWKEILMVLLLPIGVIVMYQTRRQIKWFRDPLLWCIIAYVALYLVSLLNWHGVQSTVAGLMIDLRYIAFFALIYILVRISPQWRAPLLKIAIGGAILVTGFAVVQLFLPHDVLKGLGYSKETIAPYTTIDQNHGFIRENSTLRGPNPLGAYAMGVLCLAVAALKSWRDTARSKRFQLIALIIVGIVTLYVSFSRSAYIGLLVGLVAIAVAWWGTSRRFWYGLLAAAVLVGIIGAVVLSMKSDFVSNVLLHTNPDSQVATKSDQGHLSSVQNGIDLFVRQPFGAGIGSTGSASYFSTNSLVIENQYLFIAHEVGWLGLILYFAIFVIIMKRLWTRRSDMWALGVFAAGAGLAFIGLLLPVWVDDTVSIVWWGLAAICIGGEYNGKRSTK